MHGRERNRESPGREKGRGEERGERVAMHGRERSRESLQGEG
jgi:hypothetical protein